MKPSPLISHLSLVTPTPAVNIPAPVSSDRKRFWSAFLEWLASATDGETEQLERVLAEHVHHVRPLVDAVTDALHHRDSAMRLPATLLATLVAHGWQPSAPVLVAQAA
jgi:hypothetical protein